jgi:hypothetical protein
MTVVHGVQEVQTGSGGSNRFRVQVQGSRVNLRNLLEPIEPFEPREPIS